MKRTHYVFALIFLAGTTLYAQRGSEQQGSVRALGGSSSHAGIYSGSLFQSGRQ